MRKALLALWVWCVCALMIPAVLRSGEAGPASGQGATQPGDFVLTVQGSLLSLRAQDASLKAILEAIGRELAIGVVAHIPAHEKITVQFDGLSLTDALQRLHANHAYVMEGEKVVQLMVLPSGKERLRVPASRRPAETGGQAVPQPAPFRFEFDPLQRMEGR